MKSSAPKTIAVDFDGVIHRYSLGWQDGSTYDQPMPGAIAAFDTLIKNGYRVVVFSTREPEQIQRWFECHMPMFRTELMNPSDRFWNKEGIIGITRHKPVAFAYIDDRAIHFTAWEVALAEVAYRAHQK